MTKSQLICCVKNEGVYILEWLAHHRMIGFDEIVIYSNDSDDGTHELLDEAARIGLCRHFKQDLPTDASPQPYAYRQHLKNNRHSGFDVVMSLDVDEFLTIHVGDGNLENLLKIIPQGTDIVCFLWMNFGSEPHTEWTPGNVTEQFLMSVPVKKRINNGVKSLVLNPEKFGRMGNHHPQKYLADSPLNAVNAAGDPISVDPENYSALYRDLRTLAEEFESRKFAQINHYTTKTPDAFRLRQQRGRGFLDKSNPIRHTQNFYDQRNKNLRLNISYMKYIERLRAQLVELRAMGRLNELELISQRIYREKLAALPAE